MATLVFDYDGTLHESLRIYAPAFRLCYGQLESRGLAPSRKWQDSEISRWLGVSAKEMWESFLPELSPEEKDRCSRQIGEEMLRLIFAGKSKLYPGALEVLQSLKDDGHTLIFLSNCKRQYMEAHRECWGLGQYFSAFYCTEDFDFAPKWKIFAALRPSLPDDCIIIGDRIQDMEIAQKNHLPAIGCLYGYGTREELSSAACLAESATEISLALAQLLK